MNENRSGEVVDGDEHIHFHLTLFDNQLDAEVFQEGDLRKR